MMRLLRQYVTLCWKNYLLEIKLCRLIIVFFEIFIPLLMILILFAIRQIEGPKKNGEVYYNNFTVSHKDIFYKDSQMDRNWAIVACPNDPLVNLTMASIYTRTDKKVIPIGIFENEDEMVNAIMQNESAKNGLLAGIVFDITKKTDGSYDITYKLRFPAEQNWKSSDKSTWLTDSWYGPDASMAPRNTYYRGSVSQPGYLREGFLFMQKYIDDTIISFLTKNNTYNSSFDPPNTFNLVMFPYRSYMSDDFTDVMQKYLPLFIQISFVIFATVVAKEVTLEKENKLKESMKLMGLKVWINWLAWFTKYFIFALISISIITLFLHINTKMGAIFYYSDASLTFFFLMLYAISVISFCFMMSALFSKANVAATTTAIIYLLSYVPYYFMQINYQNIPLAAKIILSFFNNIAMAFGCLQFSRAEALGEGLNWSNIGNTDIARDGLTLQIVLVMLVVDIFLYSILTWYFDAIFPGDFGVPQPFYFPFTIWYWTGHRSDNASELEYDRWREPASFERPSNKRIGVRMRGLTKTFGAGQKPAVSDVNIDLYEGNITVFLGHNGAGKTTTMFMLTGFLKPTFGTVFINGHDTSKHMDRVRRSLGLCPQHNILFESLTVEQHLYFFAKLKEFPSEELHPEVNRMIRMLNLEDKRNVEARALSGGMKRKLSIAIALIGGSKFVILDEPTSGMDPQSRRQTWEMLQRERDGRTIILSTHFMDEADLLGDRIAIMSSGVVRCYGSPAFLKNRYGAGYHLTIVKSMKADSEPITRMITECVEEARFDSEMGAELTYLLPKCETKKISKLFQTIESKREALGIDSFGASVTTMEEVFVRMTEETNQTCAPFQPANPSFVKATRYVPRDTQRDMFRDTLNDCQHISEVTNDVQLTTPPGHHSASKQAHCIQTVPFVKHRIEGELLKMQGLLTKRVINSVKNVKIVVAQLALPLIFTLLACLAIHTQPILRKPDMPPLELDYPATNGYTYKTPFYIAPGSSAAWIRCMKIVFPKIKVNVSKSSNETFHNDTMSLTVMDQYLMKQAYINLPRYKMHYMTAIEVLNDFMSTRAYFNDESYHAIAVTVNKLSNMLLCRAIQSTTALKNLTHRIKVINHPLPWRSTIRTVSLSTIDKILILAGTFSNSVAFGISLAVGTFILFIINERASGSKHSQYLAGVGPLEFWSSALVWDVIHYLASVGTVVVVVCSFQTEAYYENLGYVVLLLFFYMWALLPSMYWLSHFIQVASNGYIMVAVVNIFSGTFANLTISIMKYPTFNIAQYADKLEWLLFALSPNFGLNRGLFDLFLNHEGIKICNSFEYNLTQICEMSVKANESNPCCPNFCGQTCLHTSSDYLSISSPGLGRPLIFMAIHGFLSFLLLALLEYVPVWSFKMTKERMYSAIRPQSQQPIVSISSSVSINSKKTESWFIDSSKKSSLNDCALSPTVASFPLEREDDDVFEEKKRTLSMMTKTIQLGREAIVLQDVTKYYGSFPAVDMLSLTVQKGECFGLLGVNGAGKTTAFKMMTGALAASYGRIYVEGLDVASRSREARSLIGYCPQFDALIDQMTVRQTLTFYARLRGVEPGAIPYVVDNLIDALLLEEHANKEAGALSGGNKRKLSISIALMGNPPIIFLDEPTTGMDPAARRKLWNTLTSVRESGKTIVLTSHSMEECEALCTRLAIMVNGKFRCLGSVQHLKNKFGGGYSVTVKQKPNKKKELVEYYAKLIGCFMDKVFPGNVLQDKHEGLLHFQVDVPNMTWGKIFEIMEKAKDRFEIEDYSVSQTTLEQLFINFARTQRRE